MQYTAIFHDCKNDNFQMKNCDINIDCGYTLEPPQLVLKIYVLEQKLDNYVYPCKPQFYYIKVGVRGYKSHGHVLLM